LGHRSSRGSGGAEAAGRYCPAGGPARPPAGAAARRARPAGGRRAAGFQAAPTVPFPSSGHGIPENRRNYCINHRRGTKKRKINKVIFVTKRSVSDPDPDWIQIQEGKSESQK
jgi:hypothetical protein